MSQSAPILAMGFFMSLIVLPASKDWLWLTLGLTALALAVCLPFCAAMLSLAADDGEQGRAMGNNRAMRVGVESVSGLAGGAVAALLIELPLLVFAGAAIVGGLSLLRLSAVNGSSMYRADSKSQRG